MNLISFSKLSLIISIVFMLIYLKILSKMLILSCVRLNSTRRLYISTFWILFINFNLILTWFESVPWWKIDLSLGKILLHKLRWDMPLVKMNGKLWIAKARSPRIEMIQPDLILLLHRVIWLFLSLLIHRLYLLPCLHKRMFKSQLPFPHSPHQFLIMD